MKNWLLAVGLIMGAALPVLGNTTRPVPVVQEQTEAAKLPFSVNVIAVSKDSDTEGLQFDQDVLDSLKSLTGVAPGLGDAKLADPLTAELRILTLRVDDKKDAVTLVITLHRPGSDDSIYIGSFSAFVPVEKEKEMAEGAAEILIKATAQSIQ